MTSRVASPSPLPRDLPLTPSVPVRSALLCTHAQVHNCWLGEWGWSENPHNSAASNLTGVAIEVDGQDHWLSDIVIFSGLRGTPLDSLVPPLDSLVPPCAAP